MSLTVRALTSDCARGGLSFCNEIQQITNHPSSFNTHGSETSSRRDIRTRNSYIYIQTLNNCSSHYNLDPKSSIDRYICYRGEICTNLHKSIINVWWMEHKVHFVFCAPNISVRVHPHICALGCVDDVQGTNLCVFRLAGQSGPEETAPVWLLKDVGQNACQ